MNTEDVEDVDPHLTVRIVRSYVRHHRLGPDQLADLITSIHRAIGQLGQPPELEEIGTPAVSVRRSVRHDYVVCLDCGYRGKTLRRHISIRHGLNGDEYRQRWGLKSDHPLTAPAYSERRSTLAKALGLGRKSMKEPAPTPTPAASSTVEADVNTKVGRTRRPRPASKSEDAASDAAEPTSARRRRSGARVASPPVDQTVSPTAES